MWRSGRNRREVFERAAALADTLAQLRLRVQDSIAQQPGATGPPAGSTGAGAAGLALHTIDEAGNDCASTGRASAASSVAPRHASSDEDSHEECGGAVGQGRPGGRLRLNSMGLVKGIGVLLPRQASPDTSAAGSASISAGPDLSSLPPRLQKLAQVRCHLACYGRFILFLCSSGAFHKICVRHGLQVHLSAFT